MILNAAATRTKVAALLAFDSLLAIVPRGVPRPDRVLIVRLDGIGDFVLWLDAARALVQHYTLRGKSAMLVANALWADWARELALFQEVISVDVERFPQNPFYRFQIGRKVRSLGCTLAVEPTYSRHLLLGDSIIRMSGAQERIGSVGDDSNLLPWHRSMADSFYTRLLPADPSPHMELERNAEFMRALGERSFQAGLPRLEQSDVLRKDDAFTSLTGGGPYYVLFPGAGWKGRRWPVRNFIEVAERIHRQTGWRGVVCGGPSDRKLAGEICQGSGAPLLDWTGRSSLPQLASIISGAHLVLTNDTSAVHIAAACGVPAVCLLGGGHYGRFLPYQLTDPPADRPLPRVVAHPMPCFGCNWKCIYNPSPEEPVPCVERIPVDAAWQAVTEALAFHQ